MPSVALICFDLDGTIVDTADEIVEAANRTLASFGLPQQPAEVVVRLIGHGTRELMLGLLRHMAAVSPSVRVTIESAMPVFDQHYAETTGTTAAPYPGCVEAMTALRRMGLALACVTNKEQRHAERVLAATGLHKHFDLLIGGDTLPQKKPHASVLRTVAQRLGVEDMHRVAHVGDSGIDVQAARNAGARAWAVPWGYNGARPISESAPDLIFERLLAVPEHVLGLQRASGKGLS